MGLDKNCFSREGVHMLVYAKEATYKKSAKFYNRIAQNVALNLNICGSFFWYAKAVLA